MGRIKRYRRVVFKNIHILKNLEKNFRLKIIGQIKKIQLYEILHAF